MIDTGFLKELDRFQLILKKRVISPLSGTRSSNSSGQGLVFREYREYTPGDNPKNIDWRVYGRTEKLYIKRLEEERNMTIHIVVDASASMDYGKKPTKFEYASMVGVGFAYMALKNNEKFTFSTFAEELSPIRPKKGMGHLMNILDHLNTTKIKGKSEFKKSLFNYKKFIGSKSLIIMVSDYMFDLDELKETLLRFPRSEIVVLQVLDSEEKNISLFGDMILEDSEDMTNLRTNFSLRQKQMYHTNLNDHINNLQRICNESRAKFFSVDTSTPVFETFYSILRTSI